MWLAAEVELKSDRKLLSICLRLFKLSAILLSSHKQRDGSNAVCGLAQWEHPMVSYLTGVAGELVKADGLGELERLPMRRECGPRKGGGDVSGGAGAPLTLTARLESRVGSLGLPDAVA